MFPNAARPRLVAFTRRIVTARRAQDGAAASTILAPWRRRRTLGHKPRRCRRLAPLADAKFATSPHLTQEMRDTAFRTIAALLASAQSDDQGAYAQAIETRRRRPKNAFNQKRTISSARHDEKADAA